MDVDKNCQRCGLCHGRTNIVMPRGPLPARVMFIGEGPGYNEDMTGIPFHKDGKAGEELFRLCWQNLIDITSARIDNIVRCRPPNNRDPRPSEIKACSPYLEESIKETSPEVLVPLGGFASRYLLGDHIDMEVVNGVPFYSKKYDCIIYPIYHPAAGLRKPEIMLRTVAAFHYLQLLLKGKTKLVEYSDDHNELTLPLHQEDNFAGKEDYKLIEDPKQVYEEFAFNPRFVAIDTETVDWKPWCLSYALWPGHGRVILKTNRVAIDAFKRCIVQPDITVLLHNALFDLDKLEQMGININYFRDTMIMAYILQSEPQGLKPLSFRHCGMDMEKYEKVVNLKNVDKALNYLRMIAAMEWPDPEPYYDWNPKGEYKLVHPQNIAKTVKRILNDFENPEKGEVDPRERWKNIKLQKGRQYVEDKVGTMPEGNITDIPLEDAVFYACRDADATIRIYPKLLKKVKHMELENVMDLDCSIIPMVMDMQRAGMGINSAYLKSLSGYFEKKKAEYAAKLFDLWGGPFNVGSSYKIAELLFDKLELPKLKKRSTNNKILTQLEEKHDAVKWVIKWRKYEKLDNTYARVLPRLADEEQRVHPDINTTRATTGRLTMKEPNLMAQPKRGKESKLIRKGFVARPGCWLVSSDYSQIELRVLAHEANEPGMLRDFRNGEDIHLNTAVRVFKVPADKVTSDQRRGAKIVNFGIPYGVQAQGLKEQIASQGGKGWTYGKCQKLIDKWYQAYSKVSNYMMKIQQFAQRYGFVRDWFGRVRFIPSVKSANKWAQREALRQAGNMPIQAGAAEIIKMAMRDLTPIYKGFQKAGFVCDPLIQIHDDLVFEVQEEIVEAFIMCLKYHMEGVVSLKVPVLVDPEVGKVWSEMVPAEEWVKRRAEAADEYWFENWRKEIEEEERKAA